MKTGYVACDYTKGDQMAGVRHGELTSTESEARADARTGGYEGVRYVHTDGYLYVDRPETKPRGGNDDHTSTDRMNDFADACYSINSRQELLDALNGEPDQIDMAGWQISDGQWRRAIESAIAMMDEDKA